MNQRYLAVLVLSSWPMLADQTGSMAVERMTGEWMLEEASGPLEMQPPERIRMRVSKTEAVIQPVEESGRTLVIALGIPRQAQANNPSESISGALVGPNLVLAITQERLGIVQTTFDSWYLESEDRLTRQRQIQWRDAAGASGEIKVTAVWRRSASPLKPSK
jgi:hypothetical protein